MRTGGKDGLHLTGDETRTARNRKRAGAGVERTWLLDQTAPFEAREGHELSDRSGGAELTKDVLVETHPVLGGLDGELAMQALSDTEVELA